MYKICEVQVTINASDMLRFGFALLHAMQNISTFA
jgi:hypothetical protein